MRILLVNNDDQGARSLARSMERHGYEVTVAATGLAALEAHGSADLVVLDLEVRDVDGLEICRQLIDAVTRRGRLRETVRGRREPLSIGPLSVDWSTREARLHGRQLALTRKEFDLLHYLVSHRGTVATREELMAEVWGHPAAHAAGPRVSRTIDTHVSSLRSKVGCSWIVTVRGVGFRIGHGDDFARGLECATAAR